MAAIDDALVRGVEDLERGNDLAGGERLDLDLPSRQLLRTLSEEAKIVLQREARRPSGLHLERARARGGLLGACDTGDERSGGEARRDRHKARPRHVSSLLVIVVVVPIACAHRRNGARVLSMRLGCGGLSIELP